MCLPMERNNAVTARGGGLAPRGGSFVTAEQRYRLTNKIMGDTENIVIDTWSKGLHTGWLVAGVISPNGMCAPIKYVWQFH